MHDDEIALGEEVVGCRLCIRKRFGERSHREKISVPTRIGPRKRGRIMVDVVLGENPSRTVEVARVEGVEKALGDCLVIGGGHRSPFAGI